MMKKNVSHRLVVGRIDKRFGFTLVELLVVIGIMAIIGGIATDLFVSIFKGANKANVINEVKQNGNLALDIMERSIRNAKTARIGGPDSFPDSQFLILQDINDNYIQFHIINPTPTPPKNGKVTIATGVTLDADNKLPSSSEKEITNTDPIGGISILSGSFSVVCPTPPANSPAYVSIDFRAAQGQGAPSRQDYIIGGASGLTFQTTVSLRTYSKQACP